VFGFEKLSQAKKLGSVPFFYAEGIGTGFFAESAGSRRRRSGELPV
jgi:hypothetical protein